MYTGAAKIVFKTVDLSDQVQGVATSVGAIVLISNQGSTVAPVLITSRTQFIAEYGKPSPGDYGHYAALGFLEYGTQLYCMRASKNALYGGAYIVKSTSANPNAGILAGAADPDSYSYGTDEVLVFFAKDPGTWNDNVGIRITNVDVAEYTFDVEVYYTDPSTSITSLVETFSCSRKHQLDGYGTQMYITDRINGVSQYIIVRDNTAEADSVLPKAQASTLAFVNGSNGTTVTSAELITAWDLFSNPQDLSVNILINSGYTDVAVQQKMLDICEDRVDCTAVLDVPYAQLTSATNTVTWRTTTQNFNSSFAALYSPWIKIYDEYNGQIVSIPPSGDIAANYALTDYTYNGAFGAAAGYNRGILKRALQFDFGGLTNKFTYTSGEMDLLQDNQINPLYQDKGWGRVILGEDTEQTKKSALSDVHVRRLINQIAVATTKYAKSYLFEPLLERTFFKVRTAMEQYMAELEGLGAFDNVSDRGWKVVCDSTNNTAIVRDRNELHIDLYMKPVRVAKYIQIQGIITRSTASFDAIITAGIVS